MERIIKAFLLAVPLMAPFEAFAQGSGTEGDSVSAQVPAKNNKKKKKKRAPTHANKAARINKSTAPASSAEAALPIRPLANPNDPPDVHRAASSEVASPLPSTPTEGAAPTSSSPQQQPPLMASEMPASTVELAPRREDRGVLMIAPKAGLFKSTTALQAAFYSGVEIGVATPLLNRHLAVVFELDWVPPHYSGTVADPRLPSGSGAFALRQSEFGFLLSAIYRFDDALPRLTPYVGLGPGLYYQRASLSAFNGVNVESESKIGFQLFGGADYQLGPGALFGEVRYHFSKVDFVGTGNVNVGGFLALGVGYRLRFF